MNRRKAETTRTVLAVYAVGEVTQVAYLDGRCGPTVTPVTATVPSRIRTGDTDIPAPARFLGRSLVTVDGKDTDPAELVATVLRRAADAVGCPGLPMVEALVLVHPAEWTSIATSALRRAGELTGTPAGRVQLHPVPSAVTGTDSWQATVLGALDAAAAVPYATGDGRRPHRLRRSLAVAAAVAVVALVAGGVTFLTRSGGDMGDGSAPESQPVERLAAFIGERGTLDCRNLFTSVAVRTVMDAGLSSQLGVRPRLGTILENGETRCTPTYVGGRLTGKPLEISVSGGEPAPSPLLIGLRTSPDDGHRRSDASAAEGETTDYRNWTLTTREARDGDGGMIQIRTASTTVPGRGTMMMFLQLGDAAQYQPLSGSPTEPDAAFRQIIDGFEGTNLPVVTGGEAGQDAGEDLFRDASGHYDCSLLYDRVSVTDLDAHSIAVPATTDSMMHRSGRTGQVPVGEPDDSGREICVLQPLDKTWTSVQVVTGASDGLPGNPVTGADDLDGWEEYWAFDPVFAPVDATEDGYQSYNLRHCRSDDDCVTVMVFSDPQAYGGRGEDVRFARDPALSVARYLAGTDTVDGSADGGVTGVTGGAADSATAGSSEQ